MRHKRVHLPDYVPLIGEDGVARIREKARPLHGLHVAHVNSTYYGGGVATLLSSLTLLMRDVGIKTGWRGIQGAPDFFSVTKKFHNAFQGGPVNLSPRKKQVYEDTVYENVVRNHLDHDVVIIHDPQPLPMVEHYRKRGPWVWRCHVDLTDPNRELWEYLAQFIEKYDAGIFSIPEYRQKLRAPQVFFPPAIDPFAIQTASFLRPTLTSA